MKDINVLGLFVRRVRFMYGSMFHTTAKPEGRIYHTHPEANQKRRLKYRREYISSTHSSL